MQCEAEAHENQGDDAHTRHHRDKAQIRYFRKVDVSKRDCPEDNCKRKKQKLQAQNPWGEFICQRCAMTRFDSIRKHTVALLIIPFHLTNTGRITSILMLMMLCAAI